jgi:hypothetical protein
MSEEKIVVKINDQGEIEVETFGIKGPLCVEEINKIIQNIALTVATTKKDEYFMDPEVKTLSKNKQTRNLHE